MASWDITPTPSDFNAMNAVNTMTSDRQSTRASSEMEILTSSKFSTGTTTFLWNTREEFSNLSVVGININKIGDMQSAIESWVTEISKHLEGINSLASAEGAFKSHNGDVEEAVKKYIDNVKEYCVNLVSCLLAFSEKLADVQKAYLASGSSMAETINASTAAASTGTKYDYSSSTGPVTGQGGGVSPNGNTMNQMQ